MGEKQRVMEAYTELAETYTEKTTVADTIPSGEIISQFFDILDTGAHILDAGCGNTPTTTGDGRTTGLDFSTGQLQQARPVSDRVVLVQGDMTTLPFQDNAFDGLTAFFSLIHIPLEEHQQVLHEFARVLTPGSPVLVTEGTDEWVGADNNWLGDGVGMEWEIAGRDATREQLRNAGFEILDEQMVTDPLGDDGHKKPYFLAKYRQRSYQSGGRPS